MTDQVNTIMAEVDAMLKSYEEQRNALIEKLRPQIQGIFAPFFAECPKGAVVFTAYTPYFNDGDECTFSVNELAFHSGTIDGKEPDEEMEDDEFDAYEGDICTSSYYRKQQTPEENRVADIAAECEKVFGRIPDDMIEDLFGNHVIVRIFADRVAVDEYSHD